MLINAGEHKDRNWGRSGSHKPFADVKNGKRNFLRVFARAALEQPLGASWIHANTSVSFEVDAVRVCRDGGFLVASDAEAGPRKAFTKKHLK